MTLRYVPNYFDILPMYLVILAMMPVVVGLQRINFWLAAGFVWLLWGAANFAGWHLPAEPWSAREWFFNPFGWQLVFFTGFALMRGWIPAPPRDRRLMWLALAIVLLTVPLAYFRLLGAFPELMAVRTEISFLIHKTDFGIFRYVHFLALAYLGWYVAGEKGRNLLEMGRGALGELWQLALRLVLKVGQQSLAVFVFSMWLARMIGFGFDNLGRDPLTVWAGNLLGFGLIIGLAYAVGWFKSQPWRGGAR